MGLSGGRNDAEQSPGWLYTFRQLAATVCSAEESNPDGKNHQQQKHCRMLPKHPPSCCRQIWNKED